jgi:large subunit ribosomal protein L4
VILKINKLNIFSGLLISDNIEKNLYLSSKNIPNFFVTTINNINPVALIKNKNIIITIDALKKLEGLLS